MTGVLPKSGEIWTETDQHTGGTPPEEEGMKEGLPYWSSSGLHTSIARGLGLIPVVRELRSHMPYCMAKKKKKDEE